MTTERDLLDQVSDLYVQIAHRDPAMALQVATGAFVSLLVSYMNAGAMKLTRISAWTAATTET